MCCKSISKLCVSKSKFAIWHDSTLPFGTILLCHLARFCFVIWHDFTLSFGTILMLSLYWGLFAFHIFMQILRIHADNDALREKIHKHPHETVR